MAVVAGYRSFVVKFGVIIVIIEFFCFVLFFVDFYFYELDKVVIFLR